MRTHLITDLDGFGILEDDFERFLGRRAQAMSAELDKRIIRRSIDSAGQNAKTDDFDETLTAFE